VTVGVTGRMRVLAGLNRREAGVVSLQEKKISIEVCR
jgi:ABC-type transport system involved in cytochrome c biogenesis ATPase subunit